MGAQLKHVAAAVIFAIAISCIASPAAAETRPAYGGTVVASLLSQPVTVDPVAATSHAELTLVSLLFDTLYRVDTTGLLSPHLAAEMPVFSADRKVARILVRRGVAFHQGTSLTVVDVARSLERVRKSHARWLLASVSSIRVDGQYVVLVLRRDTPELAQLLSALPTAITRRGRAPGISKSVGTGPFVLSSFSRRRRRVVLTADNAHFAGRPFVNKVELRWYSRPEDEPRSYESGASHVSLRGSVAFAGHQPKYRTGMVESPATLLVYVGFGKRLALLGSVPFRRALSLAISRQGFRGIGSGERIVPTVHAAALDLGGAAPSPRALVADVDAGRQILAQAGLIATAPLEVLIDRTRPDDREIAEKIVAALLRLGVAAQIAAVGAREFESRVARGKCDLFIGQLAAPLGRAELATAAAFSAGGDGWARSVLASRRLSPARARRAFARRLPLVPLFHRAVRAHFRRDVRGIGFRSSTRLGFADVFFHGRATPSGTRRRSR